MQSYIPLSQLRHPHGLPMVDGYAVAKPAEHIIDWQVFPDVEFDSTQVHVKVPSIQVALGHLAAAGLRVVPYTERVHRADADRQHDGIVYSRSVLYRGENNHFRAAWGILHLDTASLNRAVRHFEVHTADRETAVARTLHWSLRDGLKELFRKNDAPIRGKWAGDQLVVSTTELQRQAG